MSSPNHNDRQLAFWAERDKPEITPSLSGRGVVIVGGGKYSACAYVTIRVLRHVGCTLPIELWHLGEETPPVEQYGVKCVDATVIRESLKGTANELLRLSGWELKVFAVRNSSFREVLYLDADSYPVRDPTFLFDEPKYSEHGSIFWADQFLMDLKKEVWDTVGVPYLKEPDFESGQFVVDKLRCWKALCLTHWMNQRSNYYYDLFWGDKSTFHLCWRALKMNYGMPYKRWVNCGGTMVQHDFQGRALFNHRNRDKFTLEKDKEGFSVFSTTAQDKKTFNLYLQLETECHQFLEELSNLVVDNNRSIR